VLEGGCERRSFRCVAEPEDFYEGLELERGDEADKEDREERKPVGLCRAAVAMRDAERHKRDDDCCDCYPEPGALLPEGVHAKCSEYSNKTGAGRGSGAACSASERGALNLENLLHSRFRQIDERIQLAARVASLLRCSLRLDETAICSDHHIHVDFCL
jgi:hypothetical protein